MKAKLFTSAMFPKAWESELNKFLSNESIRIIDVKFSANSVEGPGADMEFYCALVLYEDK
jgi:hypothetical protein